MKSKEELKAIQEEAEALKEKLHELTDEEFEQVVGGDTGHPDMPRQSDDEKYVMLVKLLSGARRPLGERFL